ncbi:MAG: hypothetical protein WC821_02470 [archaeon]|jgi:hypothetical protein
MKRKLIPRIVTAKSFLPIEQQTSLNLGRTKQIFRTIVKRNAGTGVVDERKLRAIAKIAAQRAIEEKSKTNHIPNWIINIKAKFSKQTLLESHAETLFKKVQRQKTITFRNGSRAQAKLILGRPIYNFFSFGDAMRIVITPKKTLKPTNSLLNKRAPGDYIRDLEGSIGYLGLTINELSESRDPKMFIHNVQQRNLGSAWTSLKEYKNWRIEAIRTAEETARKIGIKSVMIISSETISKFYKRKHIVKEYENLEQELKKMGYTEKITITIPSGGPKSLTYLVKTL